ncbi:MAG TPA: hypothetical protein VFG55_01645 [Rhodanobacteraceae bacterium]|nr:hypothetical protein [Rhodanobacteraceae bacterium]
MITFLGIAFLAFPALAAATPNAYRCNGCTEMQYRSAATAPQQLGTRFVYDFINGNLRKFLVTREPNGQGFTYFADPLTVTAPEQTYFDMAAQAWNDNGFTLARMVQLPVENASGFPLPSNSSAYDIAPSGSMQIQIRDWMLHAGQPQGSPYPPSFDQAVREIIALVRAASGGIIFPDDDIAQLTIIFVFTNGHKVTFVWKKGSMPQMTEALDGNDNPIPLSPNDVNNHHFHFGGGDGQDAGRFATYINPWGFNVQNNCHRVILACVTVGGTETCMGYPACP